MRATRELPLVAAAALLAYALFFGGGPADGALPWLGLVALAAIVALAALHGRPAGWAWLLPLVLLVVWLAVTIAWSWLPDRSWAYTDRTLVYLLLAVLGTWLAPRRRELALLLCALLGAVAVAALATKVVPTLHDYSRVARLSAPVGLWNQLALLGDFALPLALWRRGVSGTLLAYAWIVALVLTYSRGGIGTAVLVLAVWFWLDDDREASLATLFAALSGAVPVVAVAFALPGVTDAGGSLHTRWVDGIVFGGVLVAGAAISAFWARRGIRAHPSRRQVAIGGAALAVVLVALFAYAVVHPGRSPQVSNGGGHLTSTSSNFRTAWWGQAIDGWRPHVLGGTGAGSFALTNLRYRRSSLDVTTEPHDLPLQFATETGLVGLVLFLAAMAALVRFSLRRRGVELALGLLLPAFLVHSLIDIDWDFVAVAAPAFLAAGALVGAMPVRRVAPAGVLVAAGAAMLLFGILFLPWLGHRWEGQAQDASTSPQTAQRTYSRADSALSVDPLIAQAYVDKAWAAEWNASPATVFGYYLSAVHREPHNPQWWLLAGEYALEQRCYRSAYTYLEKFTELERFGPATDDYNLALREVNAGHNNC